MERRTSLDLNKELGKVKILVDAGKEHLLRLRIHTIKNEDIDYTCHVFILDVLFFQIQLSQTYGSDMQFVFDFGLGRVALIFSVGKILS